MGPATRSIVPWILSMPNGSAGRWSTRISTSTT